MPLLHTLPVRGQALSLNLIFHPGPDSPRLPDGKLPLIGPDVLGRIWRDLDDLPADLSVGGFSANRIARLGLKTSRKGIAFEKLGLTIPRGRPIVTARSATGHISGLLTDEAWLTAPVISVSNPIRRHWLRSIQIFPNVLEGQLAALEQNITTICLAGHDLRQVSQNLVGTNPKIIHAEEMEVAA